jgi:hypothetical protein
MTVMGQFAFYRRSVLAALAALPLFAISAVAQDKDPRTAAALQDNSFLIEEAYNQEPGVVQHILNVRRQGRDWELAFTQEWPLFSQAHQFSYSIPYFRIRSGGERASGFGSAFLNYRYQAISESATMPAFAPRISAIVPTGDALLGPGEGPHGFQLNLPFSKIVSDRVSLHANAGFTRLFETQNVTTNGYNLGGSIIYAATRELNFMFETVGNWLEVNDGTSEKALTISPGIRYAFNLDAGQLVLGFGAPIVFVEGQRPSYGAILYLSFEHRFLKENGAR